MLGSTKRALYANAIQDYNAPHAYSGPEFAVRPLPEDQTPIRLDRRHMMGQPQLAAQLYTIRAFTQTEEGFADSLAKVRAIGYTAVQVSAIGPIPDEHVQAIVDDLALTI